MKHQPGTRIVFFAILFFFFSVPNIFGAVQSPLVNADSNLSAGMDLHSSASEDRTIFDHSDEAKPILLADKEKTSGGERMEKGENGDDNDEGKEEKEGKEKEDDENENENEDGDGKDKHDDKGEGHDDD